MPLLIPDISDTKPLPNGERSWGKTGLNLETGLCSGCGSAAFWDNSGHEWSRDGVRGYRCMECGTVKPQVLNLDPELVISTGRTPRTYKALDAGYGRVVIVACCWTCGKLPFEPCAHRKFDELPQPQTEGPEVLPEKVGQARALYALGHVAVVKKHKPGEYSLTAAHVKERNRWGDTAQIRLDITHFMETGELPSPSGERW